MLRAHAGIIMFRFAFLLPWLALIFSTPLLPVFASSTHPALVRSEFIYEPGPVPQVHATTLVETAQGTLLAAWFGGTHEMHPDVSIRLSRFEAGRWSDARIVADGIQHSMLRYPTWNPVLFQPREGPLMLFYKVGPSPREWWGMLSVSLDDGRTWSEPRRLPEGILGPIKNKPVQLADGTIVCGSSTETDAAGWQIHFELTRDLGRTWEVTPPINTRSEFNAIQPTVLTHPDGRLQLLARTQEMVAATAESSDGGRTWTRLRDSGLYMPNSGCDAVTLADGRHLLVYTYRAHPAPPNAPPVELDYTLPPSPAGTRADFGARWPLNISLSNDGRTWTLSKLVLEDEPRPHGYAYPAVIQTRDGLIHIAYSHNLERIKHIVIAPGKL